MLLSRTSSRIVSRTAGRAASGAERHAGAGRSAGARSNARAVGCTQQSSASAARARSGVIRVSIDRSMDDGLPACPPHPDFAICSDLAPLKYIEHLV